MDWTGDGIRHPAIGAGIATAVAYGVILLVLTVLLFLLPYLLFRLV